MGCETWGQNKVSKNSWGEGYRKNIRIGAGVFAKEKKIPLWATRKKKKRPQHRNIERN